MAYRRDNLRRRGVTVPLERGGATRVPLLPGGRDGLGKENGAAYARLQASDEGIGCTAFGALETSGALTWLQRGGHCETHTGGRLPTCGFPSPTAATSAASTAVRLSRKTTNPDLRGLLRGGVTDGDLAGEIEHIIAAKEDGHHINDPDFQPANRTMVFIGG